MSGETRSINTTQRGLMLEAMRHIIERQRAAALRKWTAHQRRYEYSPWIVTDPLDRVPVPTRFTWSIPFVLGEPIRYERRGKTGAKANPDKPEPRVILSEVKYVRPIHRPGKAAFARQVEKALANG